MMLVYNIYQYSDNVVFTYRYVAFVVYSLRLEYFGESNIAKFLLLSKAHFDQNRCHLCANS